MSSDKYPTENGMFLMIALLILSLGVGFAGLKIHDGLTDFRSYDNFVSVKGLATQTVEANLALWPIVHTVTGNDLAVVQGVLDGRTKDVITFLKAQGLADDAIEKAQVSMTDLLTQSYRQNNANQNRFILSQTIIV